MTAEEQRKSALDQAEAEYQDPESPHYRDNERYSWAVETICGSIEDDNPDNDRDQPQVVGGYTVGP